MRFKCISKLKFSGNLHIFQNCKQRLYPIVLRNIAWHTTKWIQTSDTTICINRTIDTRYSISGEYIQQCRFTRTRWSHYSWHKCLIIKFIWRRFTYKINLPVKCPAGNFPLTRCKISFLPRNSKHQHYDYCDYSALLFTFSKYCSCISTEPCTIQCANNYLLCWNVSCTW